MITFIGTGSAFNTEIGNTSAFIKKANSMLLIDCGGAVFPRLMELKLLEDLKQLHIVITHTHPDHVGSLGEIIFFTYYVSKIVPKLYFPDPDLMTAFLKCIGIEGKMVEVMGSSLIGISDQQLGDFNLSFLPVPHVPAIPAFGFILKYEGSRIYYSGDANAIPENVVSMLEKGDLDMVYQDTCGLDYDGNAHLSLRKLCEIVSENLRGKVCCIHHDSFLDIEQVKALGFHLPEVYSGNVFRAKNNRLDSGPFFTYL